MTTDFWKQRWVAPGAVLFLLATTVQAVEINVELELVNSSGCTLADDFTVTVKDTTAGITKPPFPGAAEVPNNASFSLGLVIGTLTQAHSYEITVNGHCRNDAAKHLTVTGVYANIQKNSPKINPDHSDLGKLTISPITLDKSPPTAAAPSDCVSGSCRRGHGLFRRRCCR